MHIHFRLLFRRASEPSSSDRTAKQQIAYAQNSSIIQEIWNKIVLSQAFTTVTINGEEVELSDGAW